MLDRFNPITVFCSVFLFVFSCSFVCKQTHTRYTHSNRQAPAEVEAETHENVTSRFRATSTLLYFPYAACDSTNIASLVCSSSHRCDCVRSCVHSHRNFHTLKINQLNRANILMMSLGLPPAANILIIFHGARAQLIFFFFKRIPACCLCFPKPGNEAKKMK